jgi:hypothetical protein
VAEVEVDVKVVVGVDVEGVVWGVVKVMVGVDVKVVVGVN